MTSIVSSELLKNFCRIFTEFDCETLNLSASVAHNGHPFMYWCSDHTGKSKSSQSTPPTQLLLSVTMGEHNVCATFVIESTQNKASGYTVALTSLNYNNSRNKIQQQYKPRTPSPLQWLLNFCGQLPQMGSLPLAVNVWMACWVTAEEVSLSLQNLNSRHFPCR